VGRHVALATAAVRTADELLAHAVMALIGDYSRVAMRRGSL